MFVASLFGRRALLRRAAGTAHHDVALLDEVTRVGVAVFVRLDAAARIAYDVERVHVALLLVGAMPLTPL